MNIDACCFTNITFAIFIALVALRGIRINIDVIIDVRICVARNENKHLYTLILQIPNISDELNKISLVRALPLISTRRVTIYHKSKNQIANFTDRCIPLRIIKSTNRWKPHCEMCDMELEQDL